MKKLQRIKMLREMITNSHLGNLTKKEKDFLLRTNYSLSLYENEQDVKDITQKEIDRISLNIYEILG